MALCADRYKTRIPTTHHPKNLYKPGTATGFVNT